MSEGKYVKVGDVICPVIGEYGRVGDVIVPIATNSMRIDDAIISIGIATVELFIGEQASDRLYGIDDDEAALDGWPVFASGKYEDPSDVACDSDGNSYWACVDGVYKVSIDGTKDWEYTGFTTPVMAICVDADGFVYAADFLGDVKSLDGNQIPTDPGFVRWTKSIRIDPFNPCTALVIDYSEGILYGAFYNGASEGRIYRFISTNGNNSTIYNSNSTYGAVLGMGIDEDTPSLYIGTENGYLMKISVAGFVYWGDTGSRGGEINSVRIGHDGYGYCIRGSERYVEKWDTDDGSNEWSVRPSAGEGRSLAVDQFGHVWASFQVAGSSINNKVRRYNSAGVEQYDWQPYLIAQMYCLAVVPGIKGAGF